MVSVIIPAYNVEKYIKKCIYSFCAQTYTNIEIIIVDDVSTDNTFNICSKLRDIDNRIKLIKNKTNQGAGESRNIGLKTAKGEYIVFSDADDWVREDYIEILLGEMENDEVDLVSFSSIDFVDEEKIYRQHKLPAGIYASNLDKRIVLFEEYPAVWKKIYRRKFLVDNKYFFPHASHSEDYLFELLFVPNCKKIKIIPGSGVYYRTNRESSLVACSDVRVLVRDFINSTEEVLDKIVILADVSLVVYIIRQYKMVKKLTDKSKEVELSKDLSVYFEKRIKPLIKVRKKADFRNCIVFGSFNLLWSVKAAIYFNDYIEYYGFSSLIAASTTGTNGLNEINSFRQMMVNRDMTGELIKRIDYIDSPTIMFIDFMEEDNLVKVMGENYITFSEAFAESSSQISYDILDIEEPFMDIWRRKCIEFINHLNNKKNYIQIVIIKNRFTLKYGNLENTVLFDDCSEIKKKNKILEQYESFFEEKCLELGINIISKDTPSRYNFCDEENQYGCLPYYSNWALYSCMGLDILNSIVFDSLNS